MLHVCTRFRRGGSEARVRDIVAALPEFLHTVVVGADSDVEMARQRLAPAVVQPLATLRRPVAPLSDVAATATLARLVRVLAPEVVVTHQSKAGALGRIAALAAGRIPAVHSLSMASFGPGYGRVEDLLFRVVERWLGNVTGAFVVVGRDLAGRHRALGLPEQRFHVVRSGVVLPDRVDDDGVLRREVRASLGIPATSTVVLAVGSLDERKNVASLPDVLARLHAVRGGRADLVLAGEGPLRDAVAAEAGRLGLADRVHLLGHVDGVQRLVRAADVMVLASRAEGLPQVLVQAAAAGVPFAAYDVDGVAELLAMGAVGRCVPMGDVDGLALAVAALAEAPRPGPALDFSDWDPVVIRRAYRQAILPLIAAGSRVAVDLPVGSEVAA